MTRFHLGSVCTGYGGLDLAVAQVLDVEHAWVADPDPGAAAILAHHYPDVPNLGDITTVRWQDAVTVDILAAGFPCQDLSYAGRGAGIRKGTRSGLWHHIAHAIGVLRPRLVVLENVRAIVGRRPGLDVVLADLARLGFDAEWTCLRASDVGAPHRRERWFCIAWPADADGPGLEGHRVRRTTSEHGGATADAHNERGDRPAAGPAPRWREDTPRDAAADTSRNGRNEGQPEPTRLLRGSDAPLCRVDAPSDTDRDRLQVLQWQQPGMGPRNHPDRRRPPGGIDWGNYAPAIARWACLLDRPAPAPTEPGRAGRPRLNPAFVEWLMGLNEGHVTAVPSLTRNQMLTALGNGVVPRQGAVAVDALLNRMAAGER